MKKIDMHCHFYPREYINEIDKRNLWEIRTRQPVWESAEARIADMDKLGIEQQILSMSAPFVYYEDDELNLYLSQIVNDFLANVCRQYPDRFSGFVTVPLGNIKNAIDELKRALKAQHMLGVGIGAHIRGKALISPEFAPFFEEVNRLGIPVMIHPAYPVDIKGVQEYQDFTRSMGFLWETTMAIGKMAMNGVFERYPNLNWILSHLGGALPFVYTSMDILQKRNPAKEYVPQKPLSEYFRNLYVDTARLLTNQILACAIDLYGEEHIMFGSDLPFALDVVSLNVTRIEGFDISDSLKRKICYENATKLLMQPH